MSKQSGDHVQIVGREIIAAAPEHVLQALVDTKVLQRCMPGCERMEQTSPCQYSVLVVTGVGPFRVPVRGTLTIDDMVEGQPCNVCFKGQRGFGTVSCKAQIIVNGANRKTEVRYEVKAHVGGRLLWLASPLVRRAMQRIAADFFEAFRGELACKH